MEDYTLYSASLSDEEDGVVRTCGVAEVGTCDLGEGAVEVVGREWSWGG